MNNENLQKYADIVSNNIHKDLKVISSIIYHYDIKKIIEGLKELSKEDVNNILEMCINNYLQKIKSYSLNLEQYRKVEHDVDELIEFYTEDNFKVIIEEASEVTCDLVMKVMGYNERNIELPIKIEYIKKFCIHNIIKNEDINTTILYIVLYLSAIHYCLENNKYKEAK